MVIANDADLPRCWMLKHEVEKRFPCNIPLAASYLDYP